MSYEHCLKHDEPSTNGCNSCAAEERESRQQRMQAKIHAQMLRDGLNPERLTLDQAWSYFCFNVEWD
jgi:hypothetical protein